MSRAREEDDWGEDDEPGDEWEEEEADADGESGPDEPSRLRRSLSLGYLAMVPMFLVYELALVATPGDQRNTSELVLFRLFTLFGDHADLARWIALALGAVLALVRCLRRHWALVPCLARIAAEGALGAIAVGPLLVWLIHLCFGDAPPLPIAGAEGMASPPSAARASFVFGTGAYEELVFRVGAYSALYLLVCRAAAFLGAEGRSGRWIGELGGLLGSAVLFSAFHLAAFVSWLGPGGEDYDAGLFTYRVLAGILLGLLFRWRGPGVAAWTHGLFNLALLLGAGPHVFL